MNCQYCENVIPPGATKCPSCGAPAPAIPATPAPTPQPQSAHGQIPAEYEAKNHTVFVLLGIFLGQLGIHNFYAGYTKKAIIQLVISVVTCGYGCIISWIWAIIDICNVKVDSNNVPMK